MITGREDFLMTLLNCGSLDLKLIDDVGYDWCDILGADVAEGLLACKMRKISGINYIMRQVVEYGIDQLETAVNDRICELEAIPNERELDDSEEKELADLRTLIPSEDIGGYYNCIDTHIWFDKNGEIYRKYLSDALDSFADGTGFEIEGSWGE